MHTAVIAAKSIFYCCYARHKYDNYRYGKAADSIEEAEREALTLQAAGYHGTIIQTFEPLYDDEHNAFHNFIVVDQF